jgi:trimeric autotransporter adhesin
MTVSLVRARFAAVSATVTALVVGAVVIGLSPFTAHAAPVSDLQSPDVGSEEFGGHVLVLSNGNYVIVDSLFDGASPDVGAVYLYDGATDTPITRITGSAAGDQIGSEGVTEVGTSDFVILSGSWHSGLATVGAATWVDGTTGLTGVVSAANSLVGSTTLDFTGSAVTALSNGNYVVSAPAWDNGLIVDAGAVTFAPGTTGLSGTISAANSLVGTAANDSVGSAGITSLTNGNYVVSSPLWDDGSTLNVGGVTWASGTTATHDTVSAADSMVGVATDDMVGFGGATALSNGNYVVDSPFWDNGPTTDAGAVTWANGSAVSSTTISASNSLVGSASLDLDGSRVTALTNGDYVVGSPFWDNGSAVDVGAVTWANGTAATSGTVSAANSLVGATDFDNVGSGNLVDIAGVTSLSNGNYVVSSPFWSNDATLEVGAATWSNGATGLIGQVGAGNSLIGAVAFDHVGMGGATALTNGNYVVISPFWSNGANAEVGAVTWADGALATSGVVDSGNSVVGTTTSDGALRFADHVGSGGITALSDGNYVISSPGWNAGGVNAAGAATWVLGTAAMSGTVSASNSLIGTTTADEVSRGGVTAMAGGNYVVSSPQWDNGPGQGTLDDGAATFGPVGVITGQISALNSALGTRPIGFVQAASDKLTGTNTVLVATTQNRVLRFTQSDFQPPVILQNDITVLAATPQTATFTPTAIDNVGVASLVCNPLSGALFPVGTTPVTCTATDAATNTATKMFTVTVHAADLTPPNLVVPGNISVGTEPGAITRVVTFAPTATDASGIQSIGCNPASGSAFAIGPTTVTCTATDTAGLSTSHTFTVSVSDLEPPALIGVPSNITVAAAPGTVTGTATFALPTATDNVGIQSVGCNHASGSSFPIGITTVTCTATDTTGLTTTESFTVTVNDLEPPVLVGMPGNASVDAASGAANQAVTFVVPTATDNRGIQSVGCNHASGSLFPLGVTTVTCTATDLSGLTSSNSFTVTVTAAAASAEYGALQGGRLADTRPGELTADGQFEGIGIRDAGSTLQLKVATRGGVAADAVAVALNVTAVGASGDGFVTVFPCGSDRPTASNLNFTAGSITPNAVITQIGNGGNVCLFVSAATHLVVDVNGYFPPSTSLHAFNPARVLETRPGLQTIDGQQEGTGALVGGSVTAVQVGGRASVPTDASAAVLNVTVTEAAGPGFATVYPCGAAIPTASNINFVAGSTVANLVVSKLGAGGAVCVFTNEGTHLVVDAAGYFPLVTSYHPLVPARLLETRPGESTIDGQFLGAGLSEAGEVTELTVTNRGGLPAAASSVVLNVTATGPTSAGFVTVYPCGITTPLASNLNFESGSTVANAVIVKVGTDGKVCLFNSKPTHLVVDVNGYLPV